MRIVYPYNEILPKKRAHDVFIFHECAALVALGWEMSLLIGRGSQVDSLFAHYNVPPNPLFHIETLHLIRKNNPFGISWNLPFFFKAQAKLRTMKPEWVFLSVRKQGNYHLQRKIPNVRYLYEVHELAHYPHLKPSLSHTFYLEKSMLAHADQITVTTLPLKEILLQPPYSLKVPIEVIPLAVKAHSLPPPPPASPLHVMYVGQLYEEQGIPLLLKALRKVRRVHLTILGGKQTEILHLFNLAKELGVEEQVNLLGFIPPGKIAEIVKDAHAFIAPFQARGRMPYVAHTKLFEYAAWGRPIIAPDLPIVREHFKEGQGVLFFEPGNETALADCIESLQQETLRHQLQREISYFSDRFTWQRRAEHYTHLLKASLA